MGIRPNKDPPCPLPLAAEVFLLGALDPVLARDPVVDALFLTTPPPEDRDLAVPFFLKLLKALAPPFLPLYVRVAFVLALGWLSTLR